MPGSRSELRALSPIWRSSRLYCAAMRSLALITGTSSGIGLATAMACAEQGIEVVATMRNLDRREALQARASAEGLLAPDDADGATGRAQIHIEQLDVCAEDVEDKVRELVLKYGPFTGLVNNAGIAVAGCFEEQSDQDVRNQFETNVFGVMALTRAFLPSMRAQGRGTIVNVSSISGRVALPGLSIYAATKFALGAFSESLRYEVAQHGLRVCLVEPGTHKTEIFFENQRRGELMGESSAYDATNARLETLMLDGIDAAPGPERVAAAVAALLLSERPPLRVLVGRDAKALHLLRSLAPDAVFEAGVRRVLRG